MFSILSAKSQESASSTPLFSAPQSGAVRRAQAWFDAQIAKMNKAGGFTITDHLIYPELAEILLTHNAGNRRLKMKHVERLVASLKDGRWINTGHPVVVTRSGRVRDGQHRLKMIVESGVPATMDIRFGIDDAAFKVMDTGSKRTGSDVLGIEGYANSTTLAGACRMVNSIRNGWLGRADTLTASDLTNDLLLEFIPQNIGVIDAARIGHSTAISLGCAPVPVSAAAFFIIEKYSIESAEPFFAQLRDGTGFRSKTDPVLRLREFIKDHDYEGRVPLVAAVINAWNQHHSGQRSKSIVWNPEKPFPQVQ